MGGRSGCRIDGYCPQSRARGGARILPARWLSEAQVKAQVVAALNTDTYSEPGQGDPPSTPTIRQMLHYVYKGWRNKRTSEATFVKIFGDDATTVHHKSPVSILAGIVTKV